ncbi:LytR/AlgR family response regulator transcription factor [Pararcticibacter amylolyticus]|uniref:DNA-binding response regulator n=1 Tax=Pararcticibacter amylolyticus TaxID=2173175 RepID=A0A2U2PH94_9SPHI|nr:LytTR family DNA-binding domain-containing protein [Pararcticibacter amylolyticus]PWG80750.1 hypothetical protein DDR33_09820 [Pararcticibacter amylolyticus]
MTCYIVDDEFHAIEILEEYIGKTDGLKLIGTTTNPLHALSEIGKTHFPDVIFADVDMPQLSGLEFAGYVSVYSLIIFTTAHPRFAVQAFEKEAFDFLVKPVQYQRFLKSIQKARKHLASKETASPPKEEDFFFAKSEFKGKIIRFEFAEIVFVKSEGNYIEINLENEKHLVYLTMAEIEQFLPEEHFSRVHKSTIINNRKIKAVEGNRIFLVNGEKIDIGTTFRIPFLEKLSKRLLNSKRKI